MAAMERWMDARRKESGSDPDPERERISDELAHAARELLDLNPLGATSLVQPSQPSAVTGTGVEETVEEAARREMDLR
jgi:hypothetical protein